MPSRILALGGESKSQGTSSSSLYLQIAHISSKAPGKAPLVPLPYIIWAVEERRREGGKRREHATVKCSEVQNSAAAEAFDLTIAAATAATTIAVAAAHKKKK